MIALYHNAFSTCSQKVRLVLAEKGIDFESHEVDLIGGGQHDPEYVKLNPGHVVPTLVHDGQVILESSLIIRYLDECFPDNPLRPPDPLGRYAVDRWIMRADEQIHPAAPTVTFAIGPRAVLLQQPEEVREANIAAIPDPAKRAIRRSVIEHGVDAPEFANAFGVFVETLDLLEETLAEQPWVSGKAFGLADASVLPYVLRLEHLAMDPLLAAEARPKLADWLQRLEARPSYSVAVDAWSAPAIVAMLRANGKAVWPQVERIARELGPSPGSDAR